MRHLSFWLHMNDKYEWRWYCTDEFGEVFVISCQSFFSLADAKRALEVARMTIGTDATAA